MGSRLLLLLLVLGGVCLAGGCAWVGYAIAGRYWGQTNEEQQRSLFEEALRLRKASKRGGSLTGAARPLNPHIPHDKEQVGCNVPTSHLGGGLAYIAEKMTNGGDPDMVKKVIERVEEQRKQKEEL